MKPRSKSQREKTTKIQQFYFNHEETEIEIKRYKR